MASTSGRDRVTVVAGRLPRLDATDEIALTPGLARLFGIGVGGRVTYQFIRLNLQNETEAPAGYSTFKVTGIVDPPLVLVDQFDDVNSAHLPPGTRARYLDGEFGFGWVGVRRRGRHPRAAARAHGTRRHDGPRGWGPGRHLRLQHSSAAR